MLNVYQAAFYIQHSINSLMQSVFCVGWEVQKRLWPKISSNLPTPLSMRVRRNCVLLHFSIRQLKCQSCIEWFYILSNLGFSGLGFVVGVCEEIILTLSCLIWNFWLIRFNNGLHFDWDNVKKCILFQFKDRLTNWAQMTFAHFDKVKILKYRWRDPILSFCST